MGAHFNLAITRYSAKWRVERHIIDQSLCPALAVTYHDVQTTKAHAFLRQVLRRPDKTMEYLKQCAFPFSSFFFLCLLRWLVMHKTNRFTAAVIMSVTYGYDVKDSDDRFVAIAEELLTLANESMLPGALLVNDLPAGWWYNFFFIVLTHTPHSTVPSGLVPRDGV
jgi:hypothetical protein